ncbi:MAG: hypothetical protein ACM37U_05020, partial [Gemmatimonas sp.]
LKRFAAMLAGAGAALVAMEGVLRCFETPVGPPLPNIAADRIDLPVITRRQLEEGVAESHFSSAGARLTGRAPIPGAPTVVVVGDSYVVGREVSDSETIGGWLEGVARAGGTPLNVRQYGWRGASPSRYLLVAPQVLATWAPTRVVIPLSSDDIDATALLGAPPQLRVDSEGVAFALDTAPVSARAHPPSFALSTLVRERVARLRVLPHRWRRWTAEAAPALPAALDSGAMARQLAALPLGVVRALARAYGSRLTLVYVANVPVVGGDSTSSLEAKMLGACREAHVLCLSTRDSMLAARRRGVIVRGFGTTEIGRGHLNSDGNRLVGTMIWQSLRVALGAPRNSE